MDKNKIKSFAIWARRNLISAVSEKANRIGIYEDEIREAIPVQGGFKVDGIDEIFPFAKKDRDALVSQIREKGFEQVMEEVAYTWFNRFMGLRYMEVNEYLPSGVRILSSEDKEKKEPDVLTKVSDIIDELELNAEEVYDLLDSGKTDDREKAYRIILVKQCNELGKIIPQMFEKISDYTELLLPDNLLENGSVIRKMVEDIEEDDWKEEVEIIGWMYQYYISEKKDEVFAALKKNVKITKENIPAATQLFTPKWIVKYMVENSLGRLWLEGHPNPELQNGWKYYLEEAEQEKEVEEELKKIREEHGKLTPLDIKVLDPCMGSGHILVYAFDVLYEIYKTAGYSEREIPRLILQNNLYGLDIDDRAAQLASFALIMKARQYNRRLFREIEREHLELNLCSIQESNSIHKEAIDYFCSLETGLDNDELENNLEYLCNTFADAKEYGSILEVDKVNFEALKQRLREIEDDDNLMFSDYRKMLIDKLSIIVKQAEVMTRKYEVCITNPPYMGNMPVKMAELTQVQYPKTKYDLYSVFIERGLKFLRNNMYEAMVTGESWMFLPSFEKMREEFISNYLLVNMLHLGFGAFEAGFGTTSFVYRKDANVNYTSRFIRVTDDKSNQNKEENFLMSKNKFIDNKNINIILKQNKLKKIPGVPIGYWMDKNVIELFANNTLNDEIITKSGIVTGNNDVYMKFWFEVSLKDIAFHSNKTTDIDTIKWVPAHKGGGSRKYYGNHYYIMNIHDIWDDNKVSKAVRRGDKNYYFLEGLTWSTLSNKLAFRKSPSGFVYETKGSMCFINKDDRKNYILGLLNSSISRYIMSILSPTLDFNRGTICKLPFIYNKDYANRINYIVEENIKISQRDWNEAEESWDFKEHPLVNFANEFTHIEEAFNKRKSDINYFDEKAKQNQKELNEIYCKIYSLDHSNKLYNEEGDIGLRRVSKESEISSFISYAVGCMFGRYSIDAEGLIYTGGDFNDKWNLGENKVRKVEKDEEGNVVSDTWVNSRFMPDRENIIPITEDEYFEDDIVTRFIEFVKVVYGECNLEENLDFIADSIGRKSTETSRAAIRRYFIKDFYKDHLKVYQKRPIYWMFESGKTDGFKCLVYMHRYNEQTIAKVRTDYIHVLQRKYEAEIERLQLIVDSEQYTAKDRNAAKKKIDRISKQIEECREYDQVVAYLANEKISIDLDDGVKVNYAKFQNVEIINSKDKKVKMNLLAKI